MVTSHNNSHNTRGFQMNYDVIESLLNAAIIDIKAHSVQPLEIDNHSWDSDILYDTRDVIVAEYRNRVQNLLTACQKLHRQIQDIKKLDADIAHMFPACNS